VASRGPPSSYRDNFWEEDDDGALTLTRTEFDLATSRNRISEVVIRPEGTRLERWYQFRFYTLTELIRMLGQAGLAFRQAWGEFDASTYSLESRRMIVLAEAAWRQ
jgi:hypothetical protein